MTQLTPRAFIRWLKDEEYIFPDLKAEELDEIFLKLTSMLSYRALASNHRKTYVRRYLQVREKGQQTLQEFCQDYGLQERAMYRWISRYSSDAERYSINRTRYEVVCEKIRSFIGNDWKSISEVAVVIKRDPSTAGVTLKRMHMDKILEAKYGDYTGKYRRVWYRVPNEQKQT